MKSCPKCQTPTLPESGVARATKIAVSFHLFSLTGGVLNCRKEAINFFTFFPVWENNYLIFQLVRVFVGATIIKMILLIYEIETVPFSSYRLSVSLQLTIIN